MKTYKLLIVAIVNCKVDGHYKENIILDNIRLEISEKNISKSNIVDIVGVEDKVR